MCDWRREGRSHNGRGYPNWTEKDRSPGPKEPARKTQWAGAEGAGRIGLLTLLRSGRTDFKRQGRRKQKQSRLGWENEGAGLNEGRELEMESGVYFCAKWH